MKLDNRNNVVAKTFVDMGLSENLNASLLNKYDDCFIHVLIKHTAGGFSF